MKKILIELFKLHLVCMDDSNDERMQYRLLRNFIEFFLRRELKNRFFL